MKKFLKVVIFSVTVTMPLLGADKPVPGPPDLTKTQEVDRTRTYNLGPTGLRGWIFISADGAPVGRLTEKSRQILVTHVGKDTPASGLIEVNDVILGVGGKPFADDARKCLGYAITEAEKNENKGILKLLVFRGGETKTIELKLRVMGTYSQTAPYKLSLIHI